MSKLTSRRRFLETTAAVAAGTFAGGVHAGGAPAGGSHLLKVGLIGCGGRGSGAAVQALKADKNVKLWAMADAFRDRLQASHARLSKDKEIANKIDVPAERQHVGFDAYRQVIASCDVVLLCTPPHFRPAHLRAAIEANRHVFAEKPVAVDAPGVRAVLATCAEARKRNLSIVSGLCLRYSTNYREAVRRLHHGAIGDIRALQANDLRGRIWMFPREQGWSDMEWQMRNWYYFTWLSGDFNVEQHVHNLDVCAWIMRDQYPTKCIGMGGRQVRVGTEYGNIYDHFAAVYEYDNGVKIFSNTRQMANCVGDMKVYAVGASGRAVLSEREREMAITSAETWRPRGADNDFYQTEHGGLVALVRKGR